MVGITVRELLGENRTMQDPRSKIQDKRREVRGRKHERKDAGWGEQIVGVRFHRGETPGKGRGSWRCRVSCA